MDLRFDGQTAIVTGAGSGIGESIATDLAASGATVVVADIDEEHANKVAAAIVKAGGTAHARVADVADPAAVEALVAFAEAETGALHLLVNNAGIGGPQAPTGEYPLDGWDEVIGVNLSGVFYGLRHGLPAIERAGGGAIVNMGSILSSVGFAQSCAYVAAKHGLVGLTKNAALEYAAKGIRVNAIGPAFIDTPLLSNLPSEMYDGLVSLHPVGRLGKPEEVSALALFLLSDQARFINGSYHLIDGGYTAR